MKSKFFLPAALVTGLCYIVITPPFQVPDEPAHLWRAVAVANGYLLPQKQAPAVIHVPHGFHNLVWYLRGAPSLVSMEQTQYIHLERENLRPARFPSLYTPVPYLPQSAAVAAGTLAGARPIVIFYAARMLNLFAAIGIIVLAMRVAPDLGPILAVVTLLPMTMHLFGSLSADALAISLGALFTALALRGKSGATLVAVALVVGLCKPAYFLLALIAWLVPLSRAVRISSTAAMFLGTAISTLYVRAGYFNMRPGLPVDPDAQWRCIFSDPVRFLRIAADDVSKHTRFYVEEAIGRLGYNDLILPAWVLLTGIAIVVAVTLTRGVDLPVRARLGGLTVLAGSAAGILLSQYLIWSIVCGDDIEGVQGRYFLPLAPLALAAISLRPRRWSIPDGVIVAMAAVCNAGALVSVALHYW